MMPITARRVTIALPPLVIARVNIPQIGFALLGYAVYHNWFPIADRAVRAPAAAKVSYSHSEVWAEVYEKKGNSA